jgi:RNA polymerase sigma-70 factor, ECF subfamily
MLGEAILSETVGIASKECVPKASVATERVPGDLARSRDELLEEFVRQHSRLVYRIAYAVLRSHPDAEDATQETFLRVLRYGHRLEAVESPSQKRGRRKEVELDEEVIAALPRKLREPLILSTLEEMSPKEIAATLGISEAAVRSRVFRARRLLQERMAAQGNGK